MNREPYTPDKALSDALRTGILVASHPKYRDELAQAWYADCVRERRPFARILLRRIYATVELNMVPTGHTLSPEARSVLATIGRGFWTAHGRFTVKKQYVSFGGGAPDSAWALAEQLLGIALQDMQRGA